MLDSHMTNEQKPRVLLISNIPSPYHIDFFNELGKRVDLTVLFEAKTTPFAVFNYNLSDISHFRAIFLSDGDIRERRLDMRIFHHIKRGAYNFVVATNYGYVTEAAAILMLKCKRIPYELKLDGCVIRRSGRLLTAIKRFLIRGATRYWSTGDDTDRFLAYYGIPSERIARFPNSSVWESYLETRALTDEEKRSEKRALDLPWERLVLDVGSLSKRKAPDVLLRAAAKLHGDVGFLFIGSGDPTEYASLAQELGVTNVRFLPFSDNETLKRYYRAADVFVLPTREDVWGLVVDEAMANALPVITTDACGAGRMLIREGENGFLVPSDAPDALAERLQTLLADAALRERVSVAALETSHGYTIEQMARIFADAFCGSAR